jgi:hypothetical protein
MKYAKEISVGGAWVKAAELKSGTKAKLVSEAIDQASSFTNKDGSPKTQTVAKLRIEGLPEPLNCSLNRATINALVDAFGEDSKDWQAHTLTIETEKVRVAGVARVALYLLPEGYSKVDDDNGYAVIAKQVKDDSIKIDDSEIPF